MKIFKRVPLAIICLITGSSFCFSQAGLSGKSLDLKATKSTKLSYDIPTSVGMDSLFLHQKIDSIANEAIEAKAFPGMQVLIAKSGKIVFHKAYGTSLVF